MNKLRGCGTALVTPFMEDGSIDDAALRKLVDFQIAGGVHFLVPCGTTGESATLTTEERTQVIRTVVEQSAGRVPVVAGTGTNSTRTTLTYSKEAKELGVNGLLLVGPYYNKPTQEGYYQHFKTVAEAVNLPIILYNVPGRTGGNIEPRTVLRLAGIPNIVGIKEASANFAQFMEILKHRPQDFLVLSGDDAFTLPMLGIGADGVISVAGNQIPNVMSAICNHWFAGRQDEAQKLHYRYLDLMNVNFIESNPIPVKYALSRMGIIKETYRLPLVPMQEANKEKMDGVLKNLGLI